MSVEYVIYCLKYLFYSPGKAVHLKMKKRGQFMTHTDDVRIVQNITNKHDILSSQVSLFSLNPLGNYLPR